MDSKKLINLLKFRCKDMLLGIFPCDRIPTRIPTRRPLLLVCNTDPHTRPGEHWVVIYIGNDASGEYFDSFGQPPLPIFERFLSKFCSKWTYNSKQIQSVTSQVCGHYCAFYCLYKKLDYSLNDIINCFSHDTALNDLLVHKFVCENL